MGLFDETIDPAEGVSLEPSQALAPLMPPDLGMPPMPQGAPIQAPLQMPVPPQAPAAPGNAQRLISMALMGLAAGLGPRKGGGIPQGLLAGQAHNDQQRQQQFRNDQIQYQQQQHEFERQQAIQSMQARQEAEAQARRQMALQQALTSIRTEVKTLGTKEEYDKRIEGYAGLLQGSGYRLDSNWLRQAIPYVAPSGKAKAEAALNKFFANPLVKEQLKSDPNGVANGSMKIDLNDDGIPELVPVRQVMEAAGQSVLADDKGMPIALVPKSETGGTEFQTAYQAKVDRFKAENHRDPTPKERDVLITDARRTPAQPKDPEMVGLTKELLQQRVDAGKNKADTSGGLPATTQRRVDMKSKGFEQLPVVKTVQKMAEAVSFANGLDINTKNPADDQALIYAFAKAMDPDSVVREGEYATVQKYAQSWAQSFGFNAARMFSNTPFLTPEARKNMKTTIAAKFAAGRSQYDNVRKSYVDQINKITGQGDGDTYLTDFGGAFPDDPKKSALDELRQR